MRGLSIRDGAVRFRADLERPAPAPGECRVRVTRAGVCATDLALARGTMGFEGVPGHEFVGVALDGPLAGRRVVGEINAACGRCKTCASGLGRHCPARTLLGILGRSEAFAEELVLPAANLHAVPDGLSDDEAVFAEPLAAAFAIPGRIGLGHGGRALVQGDGRLGLLCAQVLCLEGHEVVLHGRHPERAALLPQGCRHAGPPPERPDERFGLVVEATGDPGMLQRALLFTRPLGMLVLKTTCERPAPLDLAPLVVDEIILVGSRCGPFAPALEALRTGRVAVAPLIHARFPLEQGAEAFARAAEPGVLKVLVDVEESQAAPVARHVRPLRREAQDEGP